MVKRKAVPKKEEPAAGGAIVVEPMRMQEVALCILGSSPLIYNKMSEKAKRELLLPAAAKNRASRRAELKHNPLEEFRNSVYRNNDTGAPTRLMLPSMCFKCSIMTAALETPGATKSSIGRLLSVQGYQVGVYGTPQLFMCGVRQAGMNRTPDIRTRAILEQWATVVTVRFPVNSVDPASVANLFAAAGQICGVGDFRQEKGKGSFGLFSLVNEDDPSFQEIIAAGGAAAQDAALQSPQPFNEESAQLWGWFETEILARGRGKEAIHADA